MDSDSQHRLKETITYCNFIILYFTFRNLSQTNTTKILKIDLEPTNLPIKEKKITVPDTKKTKITCSYSQRTQKLKFCKNMTTFNFEENTI